MAQLKFYKVDGLTKSGLTVGGIYFDKTTGIIHVATSATATDEFGIGVKSAKLTNNVLEIVNQDGETLNVDFSDIASASSVVTALGKKLNIGTADDAAGVQSYYGLKEDIAAAKAAAIAAAKVKDVDTTAANGVNLSVDANGKLDVTVAPGLIADGNTSVVTGDAVYDAIAAAKGELAGQISNKNVEAEPANGELVTATAANNKVTVGVTAKLTTAVGLAESALQKSDIATGSANGTISVEGTDVAVNGLGSAAYTEASAYDAAGAAAIVDNRLTQTIGTLDNTDAKTLQAINAELNAVDGEISNIKGAIAGGVHFAGVINSASVPTLSGYGGDTVTGTWEDSSGGTYSKQFNIGDIIILCTEGIDGDVYEPNKEFILARSGEDCTWVELGDLSPADQRLTAIEESYVKSVATTDGDYVLLTPDTAAKNEVVVAVDDSRIKSKFEAIDAYTVNGKKISENPVLAGSDVLLTGYTEQTAAALNASDSINVALGKLEARVDAAAAGGVQSVGGEAGSITLRGGQTANGSVNLAMSGKEIQATLVGFDTKENAGTAAALIAELDAEITGTGTNGVKVTVTEVDGKITAVAVDDAAVATAESNAKAYADSLLEWALFE